MTLLCQQVRSLRNLGSPFNKILGPDLLDLINAAHLNKLTIEALKETNRQEYNVIHLLVSLQHISRKTINIKELLLTHVAN